ncbi:hypothetical protein ATPR_2991 [Acetobacter tropicalis NBRC 101654]|uniref:Uncharacterized protein n=1 Tax=Acetobacter tropicalis NBRC 101654 TaxID=749388 RepID=F7VHZ2_9PROT|nr:hypothetical protein ATPR_2991 [Acetobacter tropicalis NBRC 101654]
MDSAIAPPSLRKGGRNPVEAGICGISLYSAPVFSDEQGDLAMIAKKAHP